MQPDAVRSVSHIVYGNRYMAEVAAAIHEHPKEKFTQLEISIATGLDKGLVLLAVKKLESAGLAQRLAREGREQPFHRLESTFWLGVSQFLRELRDS